MLSLARILCLPTRTNTVTYMHPAGYQNTSCSQLVRKASRPDGKKPEGRAVPEVACFEDLREGKHMHEVQFTIWPEHFSLHQAGSIKRCSRYTWDFRPIHTCRTINDFKVCPFPVLRELLPGSGAKPAHCTRSFSITSPGLQRS